MGLEGIGCLLPSAVSGLITFSYLKCVYIALSEFFGLNLSTLIAVLLFSVNLLMTFSCLLSNLLLSGRSTFVWIGILYELIAVPLSNLPSFCNALNPSISWCFMNPIRLLSCLSKGELWISFDLGISEIDWSVMSIGLSVSTRVLLASSSSFWMLCGFAFLLTVRVQTVGGYSSVFDWLSGTWAVRRLILCLF